MIPKTKLDSNARKRKDLGKTCSEKRSYVKVPDTKRFQLIQLLQKEKLTIKSASAKLGIHYSTAKCIVKIFRQERRVIALTRGSKFAELRENLDKEKKRPSPNQSNELITLMKTIEQIPPPRNAIQADEITFDFEVYKIMINERYCYFKL